MEIIIISITAGIILGFFMGTISAECKVEQSNLIELNKKDLIELSELLNEQRKIYGDIIILESKDVVVANRILPIVSVEDRVKLPI